MKTVKRAVFNYPVPIFINDYIISFTPRTDRKFTTRLKIKMKFISFIIYKKARYLKAFEKKRVVNTA